MKGYVIVAMSDLSTDRLSRTTAHCTPSIECKKTSSALRPPSPSTPSAIIVPECRRPSLGPEAFHRISGPLRKVGHLGNVSCRRTQSWSIMTPRPESSRPMKRWLPIMRVIFVPSGSAMISASVSARRSEYLGRTV